MDDDRYLLVSADSHAGPPASLYRHHLEDRYRDRFDAQQAEIEAMRELTRTTDTRFASKFEEESGDGGLTAAYDSSVRSAKLDGEGVAVEVLFPDADVLGTGRVASSPFGSGLSSGRDNEPELVFAGARAHNRWLADFCAEEPQRRIGVAVVPVTVDVAAGVEEIHAAHAMGLRGVMIPTRWFDAPAYHDPVYEPVWATCAELGMVLHTHSGAGPADYDVGPGFMAIYASEAWWWAARPLWVLLWAGVFERHPALQYVIAENGAWWVPDLVTKMDEKYHGGHNTRKFGNLFREQLSMPPSAYVDRNCSFAASTPGGSDLSRRDQIGVGNIMWGNDFPHPEGTFPYTRERVRLAFRDIPVDETRRMLGLNAVEVYGIDADALAPLVARVGPAVADIHGDVALQTIPMEADS